MVKAKSRLNLVWIIVSVVITAVIAAGGVYWRQNLIIQDQENKSEAVQNDLRQQVTTLQDQIASLQKQLNPNAEIIKVPEGQRVIVEQNNIEQYRPKDQSACQEQFILDPATTTVTYSPQKISSGLTMEIPYNADWGNNKYQVNPFEEIVSQQGTGLVFGPLRVVSGSCLWTRTQQVVFTQKQSATTTLATVKKNAVSLVGKVSQVDIGDVTAIKYQLGGSFNQAAFQVIGPQYNYEFSQPCEKADACKQAFSDLEKIIKSIKFLTE